MFLYIEILWWKMYTSALVGIPVLFTIAEGIDNGIYSLDDMVQFHYSVYGRGKMTAEQDGDYYSLDFNNY